jgi:hypothetical protein
MMEARPAAVEILNEGVRVIFDEPQWAPAPGQSAVFYNGDTVMGGGVIVEGLQLTRKFSFSFAEMIIMDIYIEPYW